MSNQQFAYHPSSLLGDYIRSIVGVGLTASALIFLNLATWLQIVFLTCFLLFVIFTIRTIIRQKTSYRLCNAALQQVGIFSKNINFDDLTKFELRYFSTRRNREEGWFQLKLVANDIKIVVDSSLNGFDDIIKTANFAVEKNKLDLDAITSANLHAVLKPKG